MRFCPRTLQHVGIEPPTLQLVDDLLHLLSHGQNAKGAFLKGEIEQIKRRGRRMTSEMNDRMYSSVSSTEGETDGRTDRRRQRSVKCESYSLLK